MPRIVEHFYAIVRYQDGIEHESRPFMDYDSARDAGLHELEHSPRKGSQPESLTIVHRWDCWND